MRIDKIHRHLAVAASLADLFSKDPSSKVGAIFLRPSDFTEVTRGYNGAPRGVDDSVAARYERPLKYAIFEHAERNGIYNLARRVLKGSWAVSTAFPSTGCLRAVLAVGAAGLYCPAPQSSEDHAVWEALGPLAREIGVHVRWSDAVAPDGPAPESPLLRKLHRHFEHALVRARLLSRDPQKSAAAFLDAEDFTILAEGFSGFPRGLDDSRTERYQPGQREFWVEPALRNAIYNLVRPSLEGTVELITNPSCAECARAAAAVGVQQLYWYEAPEGFRQRWAHSTQQAQAMLDALGVAYRELPRSAPTQ